MLMKFSAKKLIFIATLLFLTAAFTKTIFGAATNTGGAWFVQPPSQYETIIKEAAQTGQTSEEPYVLSIMTNIANGIIFALAGPSETTQTTQGSIQQRNGGAIGLLSNMTGTLYVSQPASSIEYIADVGSNLGIVRPVYAQGLGFSSFATSLLPIWKIFRDITYLGFVVVFVIVGFMVMFRRRIDPRTVVTIQEALPRIVITLLLVTFSYAIVGLIVDFSELATRLIANLVVNGTLLGVKQGPTQSINDLLNSNIFRLVNPLRNIGGITQAIGNITIGAGLTGIDWLAQLTVGLILWISGFFIMFKIFFALLGAYISVILSVIFSPLQLLMGAIPGSNTGLSSWLKGIIANVAVFPVTFAMLAISAILQSGPTLGQCRTDLSAFGGPNGSALWCPPSKEIGTLWSPVGMNIGTYIGYLAGFGILFAVPKVVDIVKETLQQKPSAAQAAAAEGLTGAIKNAPLIGGIIGRAM